MNKKTTWKDLKDLSPPLGRNKEQGFLPFLLFYGNMIK